MSTLLNVTTYMQASLEASISEYEKAVKIALAQMNELLDELEA